MPSVAIAGRRGERGAVGVNLVLVLAFALYAVIQLTRTTLAAQQVDKRVTRITTQVRPIDVSLKGVPQLDQTNTAAAAILVAAKPLSGEAGQIIDAAGSIDATVTQINTNAAAINGTVHSINGTVGGIQSSVHSIEGSFSSLVGVVDAIRANVAGINNRADRVIALAQSIKSDTGNVLGQVGGPGGGGFGSAGTRNIDGHANSIDCKVGGSACQH